jgi:hypothetical protein
MTTQNYNYSLPRFEETGKFKVEYYQSDDLLYQCVSFDTYEEAEKYVNKVGPEHGWKIKANSGWNTGK